MDLSITKNEKLIAIIGISLIAAFILSFSKLNSRPKTLSQFETTEMINYDMARPQEAYSDYTLDGREIDSHFEGVQPSAETIKKVASAIVNKKTNPKETKAEATKKVAALTSGTTKSFELKNTKNSLAVSQSETTTETKLLDLNKGQNQYRQPVSAQNTERADLVPISESKNKKTYAKWRSEIFASPTKETLSLFINAHRKGEVTAAELQAMAQDLIDQDDIQIKGLGLMVLRAQPSVASLSQLVYAQEQLPPALQAYVEQAYLAYLQPQYVFIFGDVFQSKNKKLIVKSLSILGTNLPKIRSGDVSAFVDGRKRRDADVPVLSINNLKELLPSLILISSSQEPELSGPAAQVVGFIQSDINVAGI